MCRSLLFLSVKIRCLTAVVLVSQAREHMRVICQGVVDSLLLNHLKPSGGAKSWPVLILVFIFEM